MPELKIILKPDSITIEELTTFIHSCYSIRKEKNLNYLGVHQSVEQTKKRLEGAKCYVALLDDKLIGTSTFRIIREKGGKWYEGNSRILSYQLATDSRYAMLGLTDKFRKVREECAKNENIDVIIGDTADNENTQKLLSYIQKCGYRLVDYVSWENTNYYSVVYCKNICGAEFSDEYCKTQYEKAKKKCRLNYTPDGKPKIFLRVKMLIKRILIKIKTFFIRSK